MNAVAARRSGAPTNPVRLAAIVLAALTSALPLLMLLYGLSVRAIEAIRQAQTTVELIPLPVTPPPPPPPPPEPAPSAPKERSRPAAAAPAPLAAAPPASPVERTPDPVAAPALATAPDPGSGAVAGNGVASGNGGPGTGGAGVGGSGTGGGLLPPSWVVVPGYRELAPHNPQRARIENINGTVLLACHGTVAKRLRDCRVVYESPRGYGFGQAGLASTPSFRINPPMRDGRIDETAWIGIPVSFNNHR